MSVALFTEYGSSVTMIDWRPPLPSSVWARARIMIRPRPFA